MIRIDYTNVMADVIGERDGILREELNSFKHFIVETHSLIQKQKDKKFKFLRLPFEDTSEIKEYANHIRENFEYFVIVGIGGSSLGAEMLFNSLKWINYNQQNFPKFFILDNVEPEKIASVLEQIDVEKTCFNIITKSGSTTETIANFAIVLDLLKAKVKDNYKKHLVFTTDPEKGFLRKFGEENGIKMFDVPTDVGGRYSVLSAVGLLPASVIGININQLLEGAKKMELICSVEEHTEHNPAYLIGLIHYLANIRRGKTSAVMMPYALRLEKFVDWWRQLWAESLGKDWLGQTPVKALGTIDQHSQIQLYLEGIRDKIVTFMHVENMDRDLKISQELPQEIKYLENKTLSDILKSELLATKASFTKAKIPNLTITLDKLNEYNIGMLIILYELATAFSGYLYRINPFDQPAVEQVKQYMYALIGRDGYEDKLEEFYEYSKQKYKLEVS